MTSENEGTDGPLESQSEGASYHSHALGFSSTLSDLDEENENRESLDLSDLESTVDDEFSADSVWQTREGNFITVCHSSSREEVVARVYNEDNSFIEERMIPKRELSKPSEYAEITTALQDSTCWIGNIEIGDQR